MPQCTWGVGTTQDSRQTRRLKSAVGRSGLSPTPGSLPLPHRKPGVAPAANGCPLTIDEACERYSIALEVRIMQRGLDRLAFGDVAGQIMGIGAKLNASSSLSADPAAGRQPALPRRRPCASSSGPPCVCRSTDIPQPCNPRTPFADTSVHFALYGHAISGSVCGRARARNGSWQRPISVSPGRQSPAGKQPPRSRPPIEAKLAVWPSRG